MRYNVWIYNIIDLSADSVTLRLDGADVHADLETRCLQCSMCPLRHRLGHRSC